MNDLFWIKGLAGESAPNLAIVLRPRGDDWLETELIRMKQRGIDTVVSLLEPEEADMLGLTEEQALAEKIGMQFLSFPIPDTHVPSDTAAFRGFVSGLADRARTGERIQVPVADRRQARIIPMRQPVPLIGGKRDRSALHAEWFKNARFHHLPVACAGARSQRISK